jgi:peptidoglycan hydrolase-like protein with peptidoglycan-binding domain
MNKFFVLLFVTLFAGLQSSFGQTIPKASLIKIQTALKELGYDPGNINGVYNSKTKNAIKQLQTANNMVSDGVLNNGTIDLLFPKKKEVVEEVPGNKLSGPGISPVNKLLIILFVFIATIVVIRLMDQKTKMKINISSSSVDPRGKNVVAMLGRKLKKADNHLQSNRFEKAKSIYSSVINQLEQK